MKQRTEAGIAGCAYLAYIVFTMSSSILFAKATAGADISQKLSSLQNMIGTARVTVLLDLSQTVCALVLAVTLYRLVKPTDPTLALLAMFFRVGEGLLGYLPLLGKLELIKLATASPGTNPLAQLPLANEILHRPDDVFSQFCFVVGGFLFACLFLRGRLIPRWLASIGVITIGMQLICVPLRIATLISASIVDRMWLAILLYEIPLGIWLIAKGVNSPQSTALSVAAETANLRQQPIPN